MPTPPELFLLSDLVFNKKLGGKAFGIRTLGGAEYFSSSVSERKFFGFKPMFKFETHDLETAKATHAKLKDFFTNLADPELKQALDALALSIWQVQR